MFSSYRTTLAGIAAILTAVGSALAAWTDGDTATVVNIEATAAAILAGWGLILARDNGVSSEKAGAR